jgi:hypothetical protein
MTGVGYLISETLPEYITSKKTELKKMSLQTCIERAARHIACVIGKRVDSEWEYVRAGGADSDHACLMVAYDVVFALGRHGGEFHEVYGPVSARLVQFVEERLGITIEIVL